MREVKAQARSLRFAVEELHKCKLGPEHIVLPWMVAYGATGLLLTSGRLPQFSEKALYKPLGLPESRLEDKFVEGIFAGLPDRGDEFIILTKDGAVRAPTARRLLEEQSDADLLKRVQG